MNGIDIGVIVIVLSSGLFGILRGLTKEALGLVSWSGASCAAFVGLPLMRNIARAQIANPMIADGVTIILIFILFLVLFSLISHFLSGMVKNSALGGIDRSLGFSFGIVRGIVVVCILEIAMGCFVPRPEQSDYLQKSKLSAVIHRGSDVVLQILPSSIQNFVTDQAEKRNNENNKKLDTVGSSAAAALLQSSVDQFIPPTPAPFVKVPPQSKPIKKTGEVKRAQQQKEADELARLKPQSTPSSETEKGYSEKQRRNMNRLFQTIED